MRKFVIITDTSCDLSATYRNKYDIRLISVPYFVDGVEHASDLDWKGVSAKDFYNSLRDGKKMRTNLINATKFKAEFKALLDEGYDVLAILCSSNVSSGVKESYVARDELKAEYPDAKIICIDALRTCHALGILLLAAGALREQGKSIEEVAEWVEKNKLTANMVGTVENLTYLKNAGRVSATSAFFGGLLNIKPIIIGDAQGRNFALEKVKGRKASMRRIVEMVKENYLPVPHQTIFVSHADCVEEAEELKQMLIDALGDVEIYIDYVGPIVGSACGPGMLCAHYFGKEVTVNKEE